ncbi:hypothetical protein GALL_514900 [mine drainage metagenome]|uniref:Uncharacterized protein n=1 Tax=mine drainage metagenome TaxID=410659 RepID=A0A1J5P5X6_9ZZZZ
MVRGPRRQHCAWRHFVPRAGGDRRHDHAQLRRHQCCHGHPRRQRHHFLLRPADRLSRRQMRHRHRSSDARRRLRLHRLDDYLADLRILHLHFLCDRSRHSRNRAGNVFRNPAPGRLPHQRRRHHSAGHPRHHADQPLPVVDTAAVDRSSHHALRGDRLRQSALLYGVDKICRRAWQRCGPSRSVIVRHRRFGGVFAGGADRRAGRLSALPSA